ncbi:hypothetical protein GCM10022225_82760 [Plantactinospora mayteni]|uniref:WD40 repeat domain-containing protein n=1 Tax=Plantactinospora mayteni TaxID=566021 RepID=A0ABQ4F496_9ACTN|nr:hypothetical protein Pma05_82940 [Plantactinospora mayteni]
MPGRARTLLSLAAAVAASGVLLLAPPSDPRSAVPVSVALAWPHAQRGSVSADLPDGTAYTPAWFLDASTSIGTARSRDGASLRLLVRQADGSLRQLRQLPTRGSPSFPAVTVSGDVVVWAEGNGDRSLQLWAVNLRDGRPPRELTADTGDARFYQSEYDLMIADDRVRWVATANNDVTEVRSVALTGGRVQTTAETGTWQLSAWPWLVDGATSTSGSTMLRNVVTGRDVAVSPNRRAVTNCSPRWCRVVSLTGDGYRIDLMNPDGGDRHKVAEGPVETAVPDVGALDRFDVYAETGGNAGLTGNVRLLVYDIAARRTVEVSPAAANIGYRGGVLWWSTGTQDLYLRHSLDLRTV